MRDVARAGAARATRSKSAGWSGQQDLNLRPAVPKTAALPGCAIPRISRSEKAARPRSGGKVARLRPTPRRRTRPGPCECAADSIHVSPSPCNRARAAGDRARRSFRRERFTGICPTRPDRSAGMKGPRFNALGESGARRWSPHSLGLPWRNPCIRVPRPARFSAGAPWRRSGARPGRPARCRGASTFPRRLRGPPRPPPGIGYGASTGAPCFPRCGGCGRPRG